MAKDTLLAAQACLTAFPKQPVVSSPQLPERAGAGASSNAAPVAISAALANAQAELLRRRRQEGIRVSTPAQQHNTQWVAAMAAPAVACPDAAEASTPAATAYRPASIKLYPSIGLGMLRQDLAASGRLWLMLRYLDGAGCGKLRIDIIKPQLTQKSSPLYLCGQRQLRNLLKAGTGIYWTRDKQHLWLRSATKVAHGLQVSQLIGRPVALPLAALLDGIGTFRAHLYTAFHSGRAKETPHGEQIKPIARDTLAVLSGVGRTSQRTYEERVGLAVQANFAIGELATKEKQENGAWMKGQALFELKDYLGQQGKKGKTYLAWQLPNSYSGQHQHRPKGRQRRINRELKDLVMKGMPGNGGQARGTQRSEKVYYPTGKLAAKAYGRDPERELFWNRGKARNGRYALWQQLGGG